MFRKLGIAALLFFVLAMIVAATGCGSAADTGGRAESESPSAAATGEPFKLGYTEGFTGFMAYDATLGEHGILTAIDQLGGQVLGRPLEYVKADNASDPVQAVDKARQLVESDKIDVMLGPIFAPSTAAVTDYLSKAGGIPEIGMFSEPSPNLKTANKLTFMPEGLQGSEGYYLGKYAAEQLGYKTTNAISYEDTTGHDLFDGFKKGFAEGGGSVLTSQFVPIDTIDFSSYLTTLKPADCTYFWIFGNGTGPFIKQYRDYGQEAPLVMAYANNLQEGVMSDIGDLALDIVSEDHYVAQLDNPLNKQLVADYTAQWDGEQPSMHAAGAWVAVNMFAKALEQTNGDTTPKALIDAMSTMSLDTPMGPVTMSPYKDAFIGTGNLYIVKSAQVDGGRIAWKPIYTYEQVKFTE
jgi:branched-chain amino acid transport system substrate-binding protein